MTSPAPDLACLDGDAAPRVPDLPRRRRGLLSRFRTPRATAGEAPGRVAVPHRPTTIIVSFIVLVVTPAMMVTLYFGLLASDQFTSEARFAVRGSESDAKLASDAEGSAAGSGARDAEVIISYIRSGALIETLGTRLDLTAMFAPTGTDIWARLPANATREARVAYWRAMVDATIEHTSGIVTLKVRAFRPADAVSLADAILEASDALAGRLNVRMRNDRVARAESEWRRADAEVQAVFDELTRFRDHLGFIDPVKTAADVGALLVQVLGERLRLERLLQVGRRTNPDAPALPALEAQIAAADTQIANLRRQIASDETSGGNLAAALVRFEDIEIRRQLAERLYTQARETFDQARRAAERRGVYMAVFLPPSRPQIPNYPPRFAFSAIAAALMLIAWGIVVLIAASVRDHRL